MQETQQTRIWSLGREDPLEEEMATHSSILAWRIPWTEDAGWLWSMGLRKVRHNWRTNTIQEHRYILLFSLKNLYQLSTSSPHQTDLEETSYRVCRPAPCELVPLVPIAPCPLGISLHSHPGDFFWLFPQCALLFRELMHSIFLIYLPSFRGAHCPAAFWNSVCEK